MSVHNEIRFRFFACMDRRAQCFGLKELNL